VRRITLGSWSTPSGNACDVYLVGVGRARALQLVWDTFPLSRADASYYTSAVLPAVARRAQEYLEVGAALVVLV